MNNFNSSCCNHCRLGTGRLGSDCWTVEVIGTQQLGQVPPVGVHSRPISCDTSELSTHCAVALSYKAITTASRCLAVCLSTHGLDDAVLTHAWMYRVAVAALQDANYSPDTTGMLNQQATWQMLELRPQLQKMLAGSGAKVGPINNVGQQTEDRKVGVRAPPKDSKQKSAAGAALVGGWKSVLAAGVALLMAPALLAV